MAGMTTSKILDNTVISAFINEIRAIELIEICQKEYVLVTTDCVYGETSRGFSQSIIDLNYKNIRVIKKNGGQKYDIALDYLRNRYPYLHEGELSTFLVALLYYEIDGKPYYYVTDDRKIREKIDEIITSVDLVNIIGVKVHHFCHTGTIGLIKRLCQKGCLSKEDINGIISDLQNSDFRVTDKLIDELRDCSI